MPFRSVSITFGALLGCLDGLAVGATFGFLFLAPFSLPRPLLVDGSLSFPDQTGVFFFPRGLPLCLAEGVLLGFLSLDSLIVVSRKDLTFFEHCLCTKLALAKQVGTLVGIFFIRRDTHATKTSILYQCSLVDDYFPGVEIN